MLTYQDFEKVRDNDARKMDFVRSAIFDHKASDLYKTAHAARDYFHRKNRTINDYQKLLYTIEGKAVPDIWSSNFKMASGFFQRFVTQENQYLLGRGVTWQNPTTAEKLGDDFDIRLQELGECALWGAVSYGFWNYDHVDVFDVLEFVSLLDEWSGAMRAGIKFWQLDATKPLLATLFEDDGYTTYIWGRENGSADGEILKQKKAYNITRIRDKRDIELGTTEYYGENYETFPIIPFWGNRSHLSEIVGLREQIDCYDLIKSGFANTVDEASIIYWLIQNAGGMDDIDLVKFTERIKSLHAANVGDDQMAEPHTIEPPYQSREALLERLRSDLYEDAMALDMKDLAGGAQTATAIRAAYENLDEKANGYEACAKEFLKDLLATAGIEDSPTFTRSILINKQEDVQTVLQAASYLDEEYVTQKVLTILGDADQFEDVMKRKTAEDLDRMAGVTTTTGYGEDA